MHVVMRTNILKESLMHNHHVRQLRVAAFVLLACVVAATFQAGWIGAQSNSSPAGTTPDQGSQRPNSPGYGNDTSGQGVTPERSAQPGTPGYPSAGMSPSTNTTNTAQGTQWGSIILSFIAGVIVGGFVFRGRAVTRTREDIRRAA